MSLNIDVKQFSKFRELLDYQDSEAKYEMDDFSKENVFASSKFPIGTLTERFKPIDNAKKGLKMENVQN